MTLSVYQDFDPLKICVVGRSYPPEFYSWISSSSVRQLFETMAEETEEDLQNLIKKLNSLGVEVMRPNLPSKTFVGGEYVAPPISPRDDLAMIGECFYYNDHSINNDLAWQQTYNNVKDVSWPKCDQVNDFYSLPAHIQEECIKVHKINIEKFGHRRNDCYDNIVDFVSQRGNTIKKITDIDFAGAMIRNLGVDRFYATPTYDTDVVEYKKQIDLEFPDTKNHVFNLGGHIDGTFCFPCPGLIFSLHEVDTWHITHPGWEVVYLSGLNAQRSQAFMDLSKLNKGKWWIPGWEYENSVTEIVETWMSHWTGYLAETVDGINMLVVDTKNIITTSTDETVLKTLDRYGITAHVVPFRSKGFWDAGINCLTADLHRDGRPNDYGIKSL